MIETNIDDAGGEWIGHATERLLDQGMLDVYCIPVQMKKNRPGVLVHVLCRAEQIETAEAILFRETTTLGIRRWPVARTSLPRQAHDVTTPLGVVVGVVAWLDDEPRFSPEYESCRRLAEQSGRPLGEVYRMAQAGFEPQTVTRTIE